MITLLDQELEHCFKLFQNDQREKALERVNRLVEKHPDNPKVVHGAAMLLLNMDQHEKAKPYLDRSLELDPSNPVYYCNIGAYYTRVGQHEKSLEYLFKAVELNDKYTDAMLNIGHVMSMLSRFDEAIEWASKAHAMVPGDEQLTMNLYTYLRDQQFEEGFQFLRKMKDQYDKPHYWRVVCSDSLYSDQITEEEVDQLHFKLGRKVAESLPATRRYLNPANPDRKIKVGFMSSDLRRHSVSFFLYNWLQKLDPEKFDIHCYHVMGFNDDVSERYKAFSNFKNILGGKVQTIVNEIYNDGVDILFELNGLTIGGRPDVCAVKPAPIIVSAIGYAHSIGLDRVDYRLCDWTTDPEGSEVHHAEKLARLDRCFLCYGLFDPMPDVATDIPDRPVQFGSFNNHLKINPTTVKLWSDVLRAVPGSELVLKALGLRHPPIRKAVTGWFAKEGVEDRIKFLEPTDQVEDHQALYQHMDIALDTFPYHGTTTTMEAMMMGVPTVTLMGDTHRKRVGASLLKAAGMDEYIAETPEQFVQIAKDAAARVKEIRAGRKALREKLETSSLMDAEDYAKHMGALLEKMWRDYCASVKKP